MYYQYNSLEEIIRKLRDGEVISGLALKGSENLVVCYGDQNRSGITNCVELRRVHKGYSKKCMGLHYVKFSLDYCITENVCKKAMEETVSNYMLMLPLIEDGNFAQQFTVVFDDWDVGDHYFRKNLPGLCEICFHGDIE